MYLTGFWMILVCFFKKLQKKFTLLVWNLWMGETWFGWMRCHWLKLWFVLKLLYGCLLIDFEVKKKWFNVLCIFCVVIILNFSLIYSFIVLLLYNYGHGWRKLFRICSYLIWTWLFNLWSLIVVFCLKWLK